MLRWKASLKPAAASDDNPGTTNLVGDWSMDETSGTRADSHGSNDLTDNNTVGSTTGVISNAASFVSANSEYLSSTTVPVTGTGARSMELWFKTSTSGTMHIAGFGSDNGGVNGGSFRLSIESGALWCRVYGGAVGFGGSWNDGSWHHVVLQVQASGVVSDIELYVDGSSQTSVSTSTPTRAINTGTSLFYVGRNIQSGVDEYFNGDVDILRIFNDELTADEITWLYNSGSGRSYSDISGGAADITLENSAVTTASSFSTPTDIDVNIPAVLANDILLLLCTTDSFSEPTASPPSGWNKIAEKDGTSSGHSTVAAYWKRASSSSAATTETWSSFFPNGESYYIWVGAYSGCATSGSPVDAYGTAAVGFSSSWSVDVTTTASDTMIVTISGSTQSSVTQTWTDGTELIDTAYASVAAVSINEKLEATSGAKTRTSTPSFATSSSMIAVALKPPST